ncbi:hypothetical protein KUCAC02_027921 [Chaenocephalus aceratus]|uniref:Uncharacterized protein n=1 Tax=Chaenocephalus aceratus TaxID=36190 RepID=A0ACB9X2C3_CHAAC|nr:hypothetical protein KUCAC02_027921 [Chaenocephalus aceratus]
MDKRMIVPKKQEAEKTWDNSRGATRDNRERTHRLVNYVTQDTASLDVSDTAQHIKFSHQRSCDSERSCPEAINLSQYRWTGQCWEPDPPSVSNQPSKNTPTVSQYFARS